MTVVRPPEHVVSVRRTAVREAVTGLGGSAALLTGLVVVHPNWTVAAFYGSFALLTSVYTVARAVFKFRSGLSGAEPLPTEAVEVAPRAKDLRPRLLYELIVIAGIVALLVGFSNVRWVIEMTAGLVATLISFQLVQPLAEAHVVSRWERSHGRLFRPAAGSDEDDDEDGAPLYVAERPVPAA